MTAHCATCSCSVGEDIPQPSRSNDAHRDVVWALLVVTAATYGTWRGASGSAVATVALVAVLLTAGWWFASGRRR